MVTFLFVSLLLLAAISLTFYSWQRSASQERTLERELEPPGEPYGGLFGPEIEAHARQLVAEQDSIKAEAVRDALLARAAAGDHAALSAAHASGDAALYDEVLGRLIDCADSDKNLFALVSHVARGKDLRVTAHLAEAFLEVWKRSPNRNSTAEMLHVAALSQDAACYRRAVEAAMQMWREGRLADISAGELLQIIESEFWVLAAQARNSGAGFLLKRALTNCRKELQSSAAGQT